MAQEEVWQLKGWKPLPLSLKIIVILLILGSIASVFSIDTISKTGYSLLGFLTYGLTAVIFLILLNILCPIILLIAFWNKYYWAWKFGIVYFGFILLNGLLSLIGVSKKIELFTSQIPIIFPSRIRIIYISAIFLGTLINTIFLIIIYKKRSYFE